MNKYKNLVDKTFEWTIENMQDERGFFYFQKNRTFTSRIPYMRWSQADILRNDFLFEEQ